jgi:hypothetical protein
MAKPIKDTPVLYGKDAQRFEDKIRQNIDNRASKSEYNRVMSVYNKMKEKTHKV